MTVVCPKCRRPLAIPPDRASKPGLKARCGACGEVFVVAEASIALAPQAPPAAAPARVVPAPRAVVPPPPEAAAAAPSQAPATPRHTTPPAESPATPVAPRPPAPAAPPVVPRPPVPSTAASPAVPRPVPAPVPRRPARSGVPSWRRCAGHASTASVAVCGQCGQGWCGECVKAQGTAAICPTCDALCVSVAEQDAREQRARERSRPLFAELGTVFRYPLSDPVAYVLLAVFVGVFSVAASLAAFGAGLGVLFSQGLLYAYAFTAVNRVSAGDLKSFMPNMSDISDFVEPLKAGLAAMLVSAGPLLALGFFYTTSEILAASGGDRIAAVVADPTPTPEPEPTLPPELQSLLDEGEAEVEGAVEGEDAAAEAALEDFGPSVPAWTMIALPLALVWQLLYSPIALVAAAISRSFLATLNPLTGLDAIRRMGGVYWAAWAVYSGIVLVEWLLGGALSLVPFAGGFLRAFVQSYAFLAIGCLLGFAVFKKAPELGLD